jgi:succinate dehydrogenase subunit C
MTSAQLSPAAIPTTRKSLIPARLDLVQSATGLLLALFMWAHMFFVSSILVSEHAMWTITKMFEGYFLFGQSYYWIVSLIAACVLALLVVHAALAMRKFPIDYRQWRNFREHLRTMRHADTTLWFWQAATGFALFFLATIHLYVMLTHPERIGPVESADRVWTDIYWPLYLVLLFVVEVHAGVGLYRLCVKWGWFSGRDPQVARKRLTAVKWGLTAFLLVLGLLTLAAYIRIGMGHASDYGKPYDPTSQATLWSAS